MDRSTYPGSDTDNNEVFDQCEYQSTTSNVLNDVDRWVNQTVEKEVLRGCKLREEKLKSFPHILECDVANIEFIKSPCMEDTSFHRQSSPGRKKGKTIPCSPRPKSPFLRQSQMTGCPPLSNYSPNTPSLNTKCLPRCPMRIAELAVPTKRQCFDTWRNKCDVLPAFMVERLRQQVMNEKPIVQISEAINCFQRRRPKSIKSINRRSKKVSRETKQRNERIAEIKKLCAAFADKIASKLIVPKNLNLNPELDNLSKVVADEITKIIQNRKKNNINNNSQRRIHADISAKIAVWIATILEDTSYKLLEEDLRELEEEEGPVLDFIDDLVNNVLTNCDPGPLDVESDDVSEETSKAALHGSIAKLDKERSENMTEDAAKNILWKASTGSFKQNLVLASPNENLLSDADESWPEDLAPTILKPSASVNRSITSLGRIMERDEKLPLLEDEIISLDLDSSENNKTVRSANDGQVNELPEATDFADVPINKNTEYGTLDEFGDLGTEKIKSSTILGDSITRDKDEIYIKTGHGEGPQIESCEMKKTELIDDLKDGESPQSQQNMDKMEGKGVEDIESSTVIMYEAVQQKIKSSYALPEPKFDYKVHPNTAPSWFRQDKGKGEPSEDSFGVKSKFKESDIRSWCKDLDRMLVNMEMWNGWVKATCKNVLLLKQKREMNKLYVPQAKRKDAKEWMTLKKNIDKDTVLWTKLNQRAYDRLKFYKDKAKIVSTEYCMACDCRSHPRKKV